MAKSLAVYLPPWQIALPFFTVPMQLFWSLFSPKRQVISRAPNADSELTDLAAHLLSRAGLAELSGQISVCWHRRLTSTAGLARLGRALVLLNPRLKEFPGEIDRTLRHELAHLVAHSRAKGRRIAAHGPQWRQACVDLGIPDETRCHTLPLPRREMTRGYAYQCPGCRFVLRRVRAIKPRRRLACRDCCRQHAGGRFDARFEFVRLPTEKRREA